MKRIPWQIPLAATLAAATVALYLIHYAVFRDPHHIFIYLLGDVAFLPLDVLIVTLVIHALLERRAQRQRLRKMNMVIGAFFSEVGTGLLGFCLGFTPDAAAAGRPFRVTTSWSSADYAAALKTLPIKGITWDISHGDLRTCAEFLIARRRFLLALLENPILLEHETFTDTLWAVFHLADELGHRRDLSRLSPPDAQHLAGDISRVFGLTAAEWLRYMQHLQKQYPYLFSLAVRTNPFTPDATPEIN